MPEKRCFTCSTSEEWYNGLQLVLSSSRNHYLEGFLEPNLSAILDMSRDISCVSPIHAFHPRDPQQLYL